MNRCVPHESEQVFGVLRRAKTRFLVSFARLCCFVSFILIVFSSLKAHADAKVTLVGALGATVDIYRLTTSQGQVQEPARLSPLGAVTTAKSYSFPVGHYYAVNSCSAFTFELTEGADFVIHLRRVVFRLDPRLRFQFVDSFAPSSKRTAAQIWADLWNQDLSGATVENMTRTPQQARNHIPLECVHPQTGERESWSTLEEVNVLPGSVSLFLAGRGLIQEELPNLAAPLEFSLVPLIVSSQNQGIRSDFFISPLQESPGAAGTLSESVVAAPVGSLLWMMPGRYVLELNGSRREVRLEDKNGLALSLGTLEIRTPAGFPMKERLKLGGGPPFAFINEGVLFAMDTPYLVFPGSYLVSLEGGDMRSSVSVYSSELTLLKTKGARINTPPCEPKEGQSCGRPPKITLHIKQRPFVLMVVEPNLPFLVLEEDYEYGVEGLRGVLKKLMASEQKAAEETLARVRFVWKMEAAAPKVRTDLVRLESKDDKVYGKSLDFLFNQPREVYVPPGHYELTYLVGDPLQDRPKTRRPLVLSSGSTAEVVIPIYSDKLTAPAAQDAPEGRDLQARPEGGGDPALESANQNPGTGSDPGSAAEGALPSPSQAPELPTRLKPLR